MPEDLVTRFPCGHLGRRDQLAHHKEGKASASSTGQIARRRQLTRSESTLEDWHEDDDYSVARPDRLTSHGRVPGPC